MLGKYVTRSIFSPAVRSRTTQASVKYSIFSRSNFEPTVICSIERATDNLINFQAVAKKRLSKFKLLKYCRISQQRSQTDFVSNQRAQVLQRISFQYKTNYCALERCLTVLFSRKRGVNFSYERFRLLGYSSKRAIIGDTTIPSQTLTANGDAPRINTCRGCTSSQRQPSLNRQHPLQEQGRLRACYEMRT